MYRTGSLRAVAEEILKCKLDLAGVQEVASGYCWEGQKERDHWEDQVVSWWPILKWILER
jgi:hypothetical protein